MKHEALASAVTAIDDDLLQDAITVPPVPRRPAFGRWGAIAAALLLVFGISVLWQQSGTLRLSVGNTIIGSQPVPGHNGSRPTRRRGARALYPWQPGSLPDPFRPRGMAAFHRRWRIADHPGRCRFRLERHPTGPRGLYRSLGPFRSPRRGKPTAYPQCADNDPFLKMSRASG